MLLFQGVLTSSKGGSYYVGAVGLFMALVFGANIRRFHTESHLIRTSFDEVSTVSSQRTNLQFIRNTFCAWFSMMEWFVLIFGALPGWIYGRYIVHLKVFSIRKFGGLARKSSFLTFLDNMYSTVLRKMVTQNSTQRHHVFVVTPDQGGTGFSLTAALDHVKNWSSHIKCTQKSAIAKI